MERIQIPTEAELKGWMQHGIMADAKYMLLVIDCCEIRPFFVFRDQNIVQQLYSVNEMGKTLIYVVDLDKDSYDDMATISMISLSEGVEN